MGSLSKEGVGNQSSIIFQDLKRRSLTSLTFSHNMKHLTIQIALN